MRKTLLAAMSAALAIPALAAASLPGVDDPQVGYAENVHHIANVPGVGGHVAVEGDRLYAGAYGLGMRIFDISDRDNPVVIGEYYPERGRADAVPDGADFDGRLIASLAGNRTGFGNSTEFLDVTDPENIEVLWRWTDAEGNAHTGDIIDERKLWMPAGGSRFRLYDLTPLLDEGQEPAKLTDIDLFQAWMESPHRNDRPVGPGFTHLHEATHHLDVEVRLPEAEWVDQDGDGTPDETYATRDLALVAEGGSYTNNNGNTGSMFVVDITDPANPVVRYRFLHPTGPDHHPIRYFHEARLLDGDPSVLIISDEDLHNGCDAGGLTILKMTPDYTDAVELAEWFNGLGTPAAICSVHNFTTEGHLAYVGSYNAGLQIVDLSDPAEPKRAGQFIAPGADSWGAQIYDGRIYVGDLGGRGLDVFEYTPPED